MGDKLPLPALLSADADPLRSCGRLWDLGKHGGPSVKVTPDIGGWKNRPLVS